MEQGILDNELGMRTREQGMHLLVQEIFARLLARPQSHRTGLRQAQSAVAQDRREISRRPLAGDRRRSRSLHRARMSKLLRQRWICIQSIVKCSRISAPDGICRGTARAADKFAPNWDVFGPKFMLDGTLTKLYGGQYRLRRKALAESGKPSVNLRIPIVFCGPPEW